MLPLCYAAPPPQIVYQRHPQKLSGFQKAPEPLDKKVWVVMEEPLSSLGFKLSPGVRARAQPRSR